MESEAVQLTPHEKFLAWFETNKGLVVRAASIAGALALVAGLWAWRQNERASSSSANLSLIVSHPSGDATPALLKVAEDYPGTEAAGRAVLLAAAALFESGKYAESKAQFERYLHDYRNPVFTTQAQFGSATCLDALGKPEAALAYKDLIDHHPNDSLTPQAKLNLARIYESQNKLEAARDLYADLTTSGAVTQLANEAGLKSAELLAKHPNLASKPAPPAPIPAKPSKP